MSNIVERQNENRLIALAWARRQLYSRVKRLQGMLVLATILMPVLSAVASAWKPGFKPYVALAALLIGYLDTAIFDRWVRRQMKEGARFQEYFDCEALSLPWNKFLAGSQIGPEVLAACRRKIPAGERHSFQNWYAASVSEIPLTAGRLACQRSNLWYDLCLRKKYCSIVGTALVVVIVSALTVAVVQDPTMSSVVLAGAVPLTPFVLWGLRELFRQSDASGLVERLKAQAEKLWSDMLENETDKSLAVRSRELQDAIFSHRVSSPLIFDWLYNLARNELEFQMSEGVDHWVAEYKSTKKPAAQSLSCQTGQL